MKKESKKEREREKGRKLDTRWIKQANKIQSRGSQNLIPVEI